MTKLLKDINKELSSLHVVTEMMWDYIRHQIPEKFTIEEKEKWLNHLLKSNKELWEMLQIFRQEKYIGELHND